jgi:hypothetical protein
MTKKKDEPRRFESEFLALPPLKMVLVNTDAIRSEGEKKKRILRKLAKNVQYRKAVEKLISHLKEFDW